MQIMIQCKLDGCSLDLTYQDGDLETATTRGNGIVGDDITPNAKHIQGIPQKINAKGRVHVRGEVVLPWKAFEEYWKPKGKANPRNTTSGVIKGRSSEQDLKTLRFVAYDYYGPERASLETEEVVIKFLKDRGFEIPGICVVVNTVEEAIRVYNEYDQKDGTRTKLDYMTDGLVMRINSVKIQDEKFTIEGGRPTYAIAVKPSPTAVVTTVEKVVWTMGLSGRFCPVAQVTPTEFDGTILRNVNLCNLDFLTGWYEKGFGIGAKVLVIRTGDILPYLTDVVSPRPGF